MRRSTPNLNSKQRLSNSTNTGTQGFWMLDLTKFKVCKPCFSGPNWALKRCQLSQLRRAQEKHWSNNAQILESTSVHVQRENHIWAHTVQYNMHMVGSAAWIPLSGHSQITRLCLQITVLNKQFMNNAEQLDYLLHSLWLEGRIYCSALVRLR